MFRRLLVKSGRLLLMASFLSMLSCQPHALIRSAFIDEELRTVQQGRLADPAVKEAIIGALLRLDDTQVRDRPGRHSSFFDYCGERWSEPQFDDQGEATTTVVGGEAIPELFTEGEEVACRSRIYISLPVSKRMVGIHAFDMNVQNEVGEWSTYLGFSPKILGNRKGKGFAAVQDSTMFVPAAVGYPLFLFDASPVDGAVQEMLVLARRNIARYRRGEAYNFWLERPSTTGGRADLKVTYPHNISPQMLEKVGLAYLKEPEKFEPVTKKLTPEQKAVLTEWTRALFDPEINPYGADSAFNIPNDADDTATAVSFEKLYRSRERLRDSDLPVIQERALDLLPRYRDLNRTLEDGQDAWKGIDSGAFLTWLTDENRPSFSLPEEGVIPRAVNNVDCVVNANVLLALGLTGRKATSGYDDAARLVARAITEKAWPECGLYYPQRMIFPYAVSRAYRDAGVRVPELVESLGTLMQDVLAAQDEKGWFDGGADPSRDLSTALAVTTLLNLGEQVARDAAIPLAEYRYAIGAGLDYLKTQARSVPIRNADTFARIVVRVSVPKESLTWDPGVFFASTFWDLVQWRSEAYTLAVVLEAFTRYALAFDKHQESIRGRYRIGLDEPTFTLSLVDRKREPEIGL